MKPNILIFMTDQQRYDTIPPFKKAITPHLDKFCEEGVVFTQAYTSSPHCCPSRTSFFSGLYLSQHGVWNNIGIANAISRAPFTDVRLWSEDLKDEYELFFSGKWHVSTHKTPVDYGFQVKRQGPYYKITDEKPNTKEWNEYIRLKKERTNQ